MIFRSLRQSPWKLPLAIACTSLFALLAALIGDGFWDWLAWTFLAWPIAIAGWAVLKPRAAAEDRRSP